MNRINTLFLISVVVATSFIVVGCGLIGSWRAGSSVEVNITNDVPEWLTITHRTQAAEQPVIEPEKDDNNQSPETDPSVYQPSVYQPSSTQPGTTKPGTTKPVQQDEQQPPATGTPKWQQPGTMEYISKLRLDELVFNYRMLNSEIVELEAKMDKTDIEVTDLKGKIKDRENFYKDILVEIAAGLGLNLEKEYGIKPPSTDAAGKKDSSWFHDWDESPSGFNNQ